MFWKKQMMSGRFMVTLGLFIVGGLHTMIFAIFQIPGNFLLGHEEKSLEFACKLVLYLTAIAVSLFHQAIAKRVGLKNALYLGLIFNIIGMAILWLNSLLPKSSTIAIFLDMFFFGLALTSVINPLITYIILEYPKKVGAGITALFAIFNVGVMLAPILYTTTWHIQQGLVLYPLLILLLILSIWFVHAFFFDPPYPEKLEHLRKGTRLWKEMHYRLALFVIAIVGYGLTETTFGIWGLVEMEQYLGTTAATEIISTFWLFLVVGQILLLIPLYFFPAKRIFYVLIAIIIFSLYRFPLYTVPSQFITTLAFAGFGCSAIFPILLSLMEKELIPFASGSKTLPFIETAASIMMAGYFLGVGIIDLWNVALGHSHWRAFHFHLAIFFILTTGLLGLFLNLTAPSRPK